MKFKKDIVLDHFNFLSEYYDEKSQKRKKYLHAIDILIFNSLSFDERQLIMLDVGCGTGSRTQKYKLSINNSIVYGCDFSPYMLRIAQTKQLDGIIFLDISNLSFKKESLDIIVCLFNVLGYLPNQAERLKALNEIKRVLRYNGVLYIDVMNRWHVGEGVNFKNSIFTIMKDCIFSIFSPIMSLGDKFFYLSINNKSIPGWVHGFSNAEMKWLLSKAGLFITKQFIIGYDTGEIKKHFWQGQLFYICRKK